MSFQTIYSINYGPVDNHCRNYNRNVPCASNSCPFKHRCNRPGCVGRLPPPNTIQELRTLAIPNENVNNYLDTLSTCTPVNVTYLKHELQYHPNVTFVSHLIQGFQHSFPIGFEGPPPRLAFQKISNQPPNTPTWYQPIY